MSNGGKKDLMTGCLALSWIFVGVMALSFLATAGLTYLIFWCFGWEWSWLIALGIWVAAIMLKLMFGGRTSD